MQLAHLIAALWRLALSLFGGLVIYDGLGREFPFKAVILGFIGLVTWRNIKLFIYHVDEL